MSETPTLAKTLDEGFDLTMRLTPANGLQQLEDRVVDGSHARQ
ncbi:MAG TPA: hypothetical protein VNZ01_14880 [Solirubrobacteraceae bacterium]|jgi:hypothetical protein|nr:hypothetical protein [Solirubrobacteraceae bacterium]